MKPWLRRLTTSLGSAPFGQNGAIYLTEIES